MNNKIIKFRAWDKSSNKMMPTFSLQDLINDAVLDYSDQFYYLSLNHQSIELMQFTGLKDSRGTLIFEGDICKCIEREQGGQLPYERIEQIYGLRGGFSLFGKAMQDYSTEEDNQSLKCFMWRTRGAMDTDLYYEIVEIEVIGNIYEHPELLK